MKPKKARRILEEYLNNHRLPLFNVYIQKIDFDKDTIKEYNFRTLLKIAYKLQDK